MAEVINKTKDLFVNRVLDASIEQVWKAWTDSSLVKQWWGPNGFTCPVANMNVNIGEASLVCMHAPNGQDMFNTWTYTKIQPMEHLEFVLDWADKDGNRIDPVTIGLPPFLPRDVRHVITFKAVGDNLPTGQAETEMNVTEFGYTNDQVFEMSKAGLEQCLDKMETALAKK